MRPHPVKPLAIIRPAVVRGLIFCLPLLSLTSAGAQEAAAPATPPAVAPPTVAPPTVAPPTVAPPAVAPPTAPADPTVARVVDEAGAPIAGATIAWWRRTWASPSGPSPEAPAPLIVKAGADGSYTLPVPSDNIRQTLTAWAPGRAFTSVRFSRRFAPPVIVLTLPRVKPMPVQLVDFDGAPVRGARVTVIERDPKNVMHDPYFGNVIPTPEVAAQLMGLPATANAATDTALTAVSDQKGLATLQGAAAEDVLLVRIEASGLQSFQARLQRPDDDGLTLRMAPGATVTGRLIRGDTGEPITGQALALNLLGGAAVTDAAGRFTMSGLDAGRDNPAMNALGLVLTPSKVEVTRGQTVDLGDLKATPGGMLRGKISGAIPTQATVSILRAGPGSDFPGTTVAPTADGSFEVRLAPGRYQIAAERYDQNDRLSASQTVEITEGGTATAQLTLVGRAGAAARAVVASAADAPRLPAGTVAGRVVDEKGVPVPGATVSVSLRGNEPHLQKAKADGQFSLDTGPPVSGESYLVSATQGGRSSRTEQVNPGQPAFLTLTLRTPQDLRVQVVDRDGNAVPGATLTPLSYISVDPRTSRDIASVAPATIAAGLGAKVPAGDAPAVLRELPAEGYLKVEIAAPGFSVFQHFIALPRRDVVELPLSRETVLRGRITLGPDKPLPGGDMQMKAQRWGYSDRWWTSPIGADGRYELRGLPSIELLGEDKLNVNINLPSPGRSNNGVRAEYIHGYDVLVTLENGAKPEFYQHYVEGGKNGVTYAEGAVVDHDFVLVPMAKINGTLRGAGNAGVTINYTDPRSIYGDWRVTTDKEGRFTLYMPAGTDWTLRWAGGRQEVKGLQPHEVREVQLDKAAGPATDESRLVNYRVRVLGPDGSTIPRPPLQWTVKLADYQMSGRATMAGPNQAVVSSMDGLVEVWMNTNFAGLEFSSPFMDKPVLVPISDFKDGAIPRLKFDRAPQEVPALQRMPPGALSAPPTSSLLIPAPLAVGDLVPEFKDVQWVSGGPLRFADLKGRLVLVAFNFRDGDDRLTPLLERIKDQPVTTVLVARGTVGISQTPGPGFTATMQDPVLPNGYGFYYTLFGQSSGCALIGPDGRFLAGGLTAPKLGAKVDQALELVRVEEG